MNDTPGRGTGHELVLDILPQPDDATCGPTCLHAVYRYHGDPLPLSRVIGEVESHASGGTQAVSLANHALARGYGALIYTYNLTLFDPTWFDDPGADLAERLAAQARVKAEPRLQQVTASYLEFLRLGGRLEYRDLEPELIRLWLGRDRPLITGLSATYLYGSARELGSHQLRPDDVAGFPTGHFVVLCGWDPGRGRVLVADPLEDDARSGSLSYWVPVDRVIGAILLGVLTYDANLLVLEPPARGPGAA
jgi:hypothetical protein